MAATATSKARKRLTLNGMSSSTAEGEIQR